MHSTLRPQKTFLSSHDNNHVIPQLTSPHQATIHRLTHLGITNYNQNKQKAATQLESNALHFLLYLSNSTILPIIKSILFNKSSPKSTFITMSSFNPSAPPMPTSSSSSPYSNPNQNYNHNHHHNYNYNQSPNYNYPSPNQAHTQTYHVCHQPNFAPPSTSTPSYGGSSNFGYNYSSSNNAFPPGTDPEIIRSFQMVDRDNSGFIDDSELQNALSMGYNRFNLSTVRLLIFLFKSPSEKSLIIRPGEFASLWSCLGQWRAIFERFDRDRCGIDLEELRDALYSLGYAVPPPVLQLLISRYDSGSGRKTHLNFDSFVECGMVVKGLTEKFKEKDPRYTGSATITYDDFMSMVLPYLVTYN